MLCLGKTCSYLERMATDRIKGGERVLLECSAAGRHPACSEPRQGGTACPLLFPSLTSAGALTIRNSSFSHIAPRFREEEEYLKD